MNMDTMQNICRLLQDLASLGGGTLAKMGGASLGGDESTFISSPTANARAIAAAVRDGKEEEVLRISHDMIALGYLDFLTDCVEELVKGGDASLASQLNWRGIQLGKSDVVESLTTNMAKREGKEDIAARVTAGMAVLADMEKALPRAGAAMAPAIAKAVDEGGLDQVVQVVELLVNVYDQAALVEQVDLALVEMGREDVAGQVTRGALSSGSGAVAAGRVAGKMVGHGNIKSGWKSATS